FAGDVDHILRPTDQTEARLALHFDHIAERRPPVDVAAQCAPAVAVALEADAGHQSPGVFSGRAARGEHAGFGEAVDFTQFAAVAAFKVFRRFARERCGRR